MISRRFVVHILTTVFVVVVLLPLPVAADLLSEAVAAMQRGAPDEALPLLRQARQQAPQRVELKGWLAECYLLVARQQMQRRDFLPAAATLAEGREQADAGDDPRFWEARGHVLFAAGDLLAAESELRQALTLDANNISALGLLARLHYDRGELYQAEMLLSDALELAPDDAQLIELSRKVKRERIYEEQLSTSVGGIFTVTFGGTRKDRLGGEVREVLEEAYNEVGRQFDQYPAGPIAVILYSAADFRSMTGAPDWSGGLYDGKIRIPVGGLASVTPELRVVLYHEYAHLLVAQRAGRQVPRWFNEGLAQVVSLQGHPDVALAGERRTSPLTIEQLEQVFAAGQSEGIEQAYFQAHQLVDYLLRRCGWSDMLALLDSFGHRSAGGKKTLCGTNLAELVEEWRLSVASDREGRR